MESSRTASTFSARTLPVILIVALVQGVALYLLHRAIDHRVWPATSAAWLTALYVVAVFVPPTLQLLVRHLQDRATWVICTTLGFAFVYFGWHHGASIAEESTRAGADPSVQFALAFLLVVLWLHVMPFLQSRIERGVWRVPYGELFATAWRNMLLLAEAGLFTGLLWLLLFLWEMLFDMLGIRYFQYLFSEPVFVYPVTALTFGTALHLIGSIDRLTSVLLEQVLNVLKWLALVAGLILTLFSVALVLKLPNLVFTGTRAIGAGWLLWLVAVMVLLINAAYRDGSVAQPYPLQIGRALRFIMPLLVLIALTALYALVVRARSYGLTVQRVWAFVVALAALAYAVGYTVTALKSDHWMRGIARVNVGVTLGVVAVICLALTPLLSPYRLAASSQYRLALEGNAKHPPEDYTSNGPFHYLRFQAGRYGREKLAQLARLTDHPHAREIAAAALAAQQQQLPWIDGPPKTNEQRIAQLVVYPLGAKLDSLLRERLLADMNSGPLVGVATDSRGWSGLFVDLNDDSTDEFILLLPNGNAFAYLRAADDWKPSGWMTRSGPWDASELHTALDRGDFRAESAHWKDLRIGRSAFRVNATD